MARKPFSPPPRTPSFFKVLIGDFSTRLRIPPAFKKHLEGIVSQKCILWSSAKRSWNVNIRQVENHFLFQEGWSAFVKDHSLEIGDFLLFRYAGNSQFHVEMYGKNCCEKNAPTTEAAKNGHQPNGLQEKIQQESAGQRVTRRSSRCRVAEAEANDEEGALEAAKKFMSTSKYPSLIRVVKPSYLQKGYLDIGLSFVNTHVKKSKTTMKLQVSEKLWPVNLISYQNSAKLCGGFCAFAKEHCLQVGDVCVFELINRDNDAVLKVSIFTNMN